MKILFLNTGLYTLNGISQVIYSYISNLKKIDKSIQIDVSVFGYIDQFYIKEFAKCNVEIKRLCDRRKVFKYRKELKDIIKTGSYDIVHVHGNSATMVLELSVAKKCKVPVRIAHSHNSTCGSMLRHKLLLPFFKKSYIHALACSKLAGDWIFGEGNFTVINNGIDIEKFKFNQDERVAIRRELGIEDNFVIGHIGRFNEQKNHTFLLDIFYEFLKIRQDAILMLLGAGPLYDVIEKKATDMGILNHVVFVGEQPDAYKYYNAMDIFVFPSKWEGLGIVNIEAQANGLPVLASTEIPEIAKCTERIWFKPLADGAQSWGEEIERILNLNIIRTVDLLPNIAAHGFDINSEVKRLRDIYFNW